MNYENNQAKWLGISRRSLNVSTLHFSFHSPLSLPKRSNKIKVVFRPLGLNFLIHEIKIRHPTSQGHCEG